MTSSGTPSDASDKKHLDVVITTPGEPSDQRFGERRRAILATGAIHQGSGRWHLRINNTDPLPLGLINTLFVIAARFHATIQLHYPEPPDVITHNPDARPDQTPPDDHKTGTSP